MVAPAVAAAGISAGASILGSVFGSRSSSRNRRRAEAREDTRFQRSVTDAKAAGLHPLFALGAAGAGSPSFISGQSETGGLDRDAINKIGGFVNAKVQDSLKSKTELTQAQANLALVETLRHQISNDTGAFIDAPKQMMGTQATVDKLSGLVEIEPQKVRPGAKGDPSKTAGVNPAFMQINFGGGITADVPWSDEGWAEAMSIDKLPAIVIAGLRNAYKLGKLSYSKMIEGISILNKKNPKQAGKFFRNFTTRRGANMKAPKGFFSPKMPAPRRM